MLRCVVVVRLGSAATAAGTSTAHAPRVGDRADQHHRLAGTYTVPGISPGMIMCCPVAHIPVLTLMSLEQAGDQLSPELRVPRKALVTATRQVGSSPPSTQDRYPDDAMA